MRWVRILLAVAMAIAGMLPVGPVRAASSDFEAAVQAWEAQDRWNPPPTGAVVVTGSSTIQNWSSMASDLSPLVTINRGLGGTTADDIDYFLERIVLVYRPRAVVLYEGDNDLGNGLTPQYFADRMAGILSRISARLPDARVFVISVKPSPARWWLWSKMTQANQLLAAICGRDARYTYINVGPALLGSNGQPRPEFYAADGLHLTGAGYAAWTSVIRPVLLSKLAASTPTVSVTATPSTVVSGSSTTLTWSSSNATSCTAWGGWSGNKSGSGSAGSPALYSGTTFGLSCTGPGGTTSNSAYVAVTAPTPAPVVTLSATPSTVTRGSTTRLIWSASNASSCTASGGWTGWRAASGAEDSDWLQANTTFTLACTGTGGSGSASASVVVTIPTPAPTVTLAASPASLIRGGASQLSWSSTNASSCTASGGWSGSRNTVGSEVLTPQASANFVLTCTGAGGTGTASQPIAVTEPLPAPTVSMMASPSTIASGASAQLSWTSTQASACTASGGWSGTRPVSGSETLPPLVASAAFVLSCTGPGGTASSSQEITVTAPPAPAPAPAPDPIPEPTLPPPVAPTVTLQAGASSVAPGESTQLSWSSSNAASCMASGGWNAERSTSGAESSPQLQGATSFTLTCTGPGGSATTTLEVSIKPPVPVVSLTALPATVSAGGKGQLSWTSVSADSCEATGDWSGIRAPVGGEETVALTRASTFGLRCTGPGGTVSTAVTIEVAATAPPQIDTVTATSAVGSYTGGGGGVLGEFELGGLLFVAACRRRKRRLR